MKSTCHRSVLVLGDDVSSCLAIVRSLGRQGIRVVLGTQHPESLVVFSRYVSSVIEFPPSEAGIDAWWTKLRDVLRQETFELVIPASDGYLVPLALNRSEFEKLATLAIPDEFGFERTYRKEKTVEMATALQVPIPKTFFARNAAELEAIAAAELALPVYVKPVASKMWHDGKRIDPPVRRAHSPEDVVRFGTPLLKLGGALVQNAFCGIGVGQEFLTDRGEILLALQHERVHEPLGGGGAYYRKSVPLDPEMLKHSKRMLEHLHWTGVAMIEYKMNPATREFTLMEINGRFWGSLPLAIAAGADFPAELYRLLIEGKRPVSNSYRLGVFSRNLTPDLFWFAANWRADRSNPHLMTMSRSRAAREWLNVFSGREYWDSFAFDDLKPARQECRRLIERVTSKITEKVGNRVHSAVALNPLVRRLRRHKMRLALKRTPRLLFMCYGNICRSPFAAAYAEFVLRQLSEVGVSVVSAGMHAKAKRISPSNAILAAAEVEIDIARHRSRVADAELIDSAGVILCMDRTNYEALRSAWPNSSDRLFLLGEFAPIGRNIEISDPFNGSIEEFRRCYDRIRTAVEAVVEEIILPQRTGRGQTQTVIHLTATLGKR